MAKMKVHELAKELDKQSKELIAFLQEKGIDVKAAQSSIEEEAAALVRTHFKKNKPEAPEKKEEKTEKMEMKEEKPMTKEGGAGNEAPKKKKKIIFVSNPHNRETGNRSGGRKTEARIEMKTGAIIGMTDGGRMARIADLLKIIKVIKGIGAVMLAARIITGLVEIMSALTGEMEGRTIDSESLRLLKDSCRRTLSKIRRSIGMRKNAESVRKKINVPRKI